MNRKNITRLAFAIVILSFVLSTFVSLWPLSCGWASSREFPSENIAELIRISDERMYAAKDEYCRASGNDRRRR